MQPTSVSARTRASGFRAWIAAGVIVLAGVGAYSNSFDGVFALDDRVAVALNPTIRTLWPLTRAMNAPRDTALAGRPVANLSFAMTYALAPADARDVFTAGSGADQAAVDRFQRNLWTYHAVNLGIHLLTALALFGVMRRTLRAPAVAARLGSHADMLALATATIWVVHPLTTAAVTYVVQRVESLMGLFYLLTLYCAIRAEGPAEAGHHVQKGPAEAGHYVQNRAAAPTRAVLAYAAPSHPAPSYVVSGFSRTVWTIGAILACALGMGTKEAFVTAPVMVLLWDFLMLDGPPDRLRQGYGAQEGGHYALRPRHAMLRRRWRLYIGLAATWTLLAGLMAFAPRAGSVGFGLEGVTSWAYLRTQAGVIAHYLHLAFAPWPLSLDYEWPIATSIADVVAPGVIVLTLVAATVWGLARRAAWAFAGVWFFLILAPTSSVVPIVTEVAADHRMYLPLAAIVALVSLVAVRLLPRVSVLVAATALVVGLATLTHARNTDYASQERLYAATVETRPSNARARSNLASVLIEQGRSTEAEALLREAIRLKPAYADAYANLGVAYVVEGRSLDALPLFERAIQLAPESVDVWRNYGEALGSVGRFADAARAFRKTLPLRPDDPNLLEGLAWILATAPDSSLRDGKSALDLATRAAQLVSEPTPNVLDTLAAAYAENARFAEAAATAERALALARSTRRADLIPQIEVRLQLYQNGQPYREPTRH